MSDKTAIAQGMSALSAECDAHMPTVASGAAADPEAADSPRASGLRQELVAYLIAEGDLKDNRVADAMRRVPRHAFIPDMRLDEAYGNFPLPIGFDQTISQPTVIAIMTEALGLGGRESVLEIGTGSGYQAAILSVLSREVFTIELVPELGNRSSRRLADLGYANVHVRVGDGYKGWPERAPFDRILVTAAPQAVPQALFDQLADGGVLVAPVGRSSQVQTLLRYRKHDGHLDVDDLGPVAFVPMVSSAPVLPRAPGPARARR